MPQITEAPKTIPEPAGGLLWVAERDPDRPWGRHGAVRHFPDFVCDGRGFVVSNEYVAFVGASEGLCLVFGPRDGRGKPRGGVAIAVEA